MFVAGEKHEKGDKSLSFGILAVVAIVAVVGLVVMFMNGGKAAVVQPATPVVVASGSEEANVGGQAIAARFRVLSDQEVAVLESNYQYVPTSEIHTEYTTDILGKNIKLSSVSFQLKSLSDGRAGSVGGTFTCSASCGGGCGVSGCDPRGDILRACTACHCWGAEQCDDETCTCTKSVSVQSISGNME